MIEEIWKDIPGYEGYYQASNLGKIKSLDRYVNGKNKSKVFIKGKILISDINKGGYEYVCLSKNHIHKKFYVHRLCLNAFYGINNNLHINHQDGNRCNNILTNLEFCTMSENGKHSYRVLGRINPMLGRVGHKHPSSKPVAQYDIHNNFIKIYESQLLASKILGIDSSGISKCCKNKKKIYKGYIWKYI